MTKLFQKAAFDVSVPVFSLWHGGHAWNGAPQMRARSRGKCENGPGIDLTTDLATACKYARGGGSVMRFVVAEPRKWLEDGQATVPLADALDFYRNLPRVPNRARILEDLRMNAERLGRSVVQAACVVNLGVNHDAFVGSVGPELCRRLVEWGVDASCTRRYGEEYWVNLFNPDLVICVDKTLASDDRCERYSLPAQQLAVNRLRTEELLALMQRCLDGEVRESPAICGLDEAIASSALPEQAAARARVDALLRQLELPAKTAWRQFHGLVQEGTVWCSQAGAHLLGTMKGVTCLDPVGEAGVRRVAITPLGRAALLLFPSDFTLSLSAETANSVGRPFVGQAPSVELA